MSSEAREALTLDVAVQDALHVEQLERLQQLPQQTQHHALHPLHALA